MTRNAQLKASSAGTHQPECACGLAFPGPWDLVAHFLEVHPPSPRELLDDGQHGDATRLAVKLNTSSPFAWEVVTWASDQRSDLRVAASIAYRVKAGDLKRSDTMTRQDIRDTYQVPLHVAGSVINILLDYEVFTNYGHRDGVACDNVDDAVGARFAYGQMLHSILRHVAKLDDEISGLKQLSHADTA